MADQKPAAPVKSKVEALAQLERQRREVTEQIAAYRAEALAEIVGTATGQAEQIGISAEELAQAFAKSAKHATKGGAASRAAAPAKYRNPKNQDETWSGRGRKPQWVVDALAGGATLESLQIAPAPAKG